MSHIYLKNIYIITYNIFFLCQNSVKMAKSMRFFATVFLLAMLVMATEMGSMRIADARHCESQSQRFKGPCVRKKNCAAICETEGFPSGDCRGFRRRCFCTKPC